MIRRFHIWIVLMCMMGPGIASVLGQSEVSGWGNLRGIRVGDQLVPFTTAVGIYNSDFTQLTLSQREGPTRTTQYVREGNAVSTGIALQYGGRGGRGATTNPSPNGTINYVVTYNDTAAGVCQVHVRLTSQTAQTIGGLYYFLTLPAADFANATARVSGEGNADVPLTTPNDAARFLAAKGNGIRIFTSDKRSIEVSFSSPLDLVVQQSRARSNDSDIQIYFPLAVGNLGAGQTVDTAFTLKVSADADASPVTITLDPSKTGRKFDGIGGNYRIQNARLDPLHIQYIFDNMRVAFGRVAMPWNTWQPREDAPPPLVSGAPPQTQPNRGRGGGAMNSIQSALEIAQTLAKKNIPMIISCWSPPSWAVLSSGNRGERGQHLDPAKWDAICQSIGSYLVYLRDHYGAEPLYFSFNESDAGINVRQTPEEHAEAIRKLGAHFKAIGLKTRMLLGDTGDVPPVNFIQTALNDPQAAQYIGAISFHSWRGATDEQYQRWADAAAKLNVSLLDAEGGNDAQAYSYPNLFREEWYALDEAAEYIRIMRICQPQAILQWQFTENYSVLASDRDGKLQPTQRFFNLKQFNLTPAGSNWIDVQSTSPLVLAAAFVDQVSGMHAIHLVNNGTSRAVTIKGFPAPITRLKIYVTDKSRGLAQLEDIQVNNGSGQLTLPGRALITLIGVTR